MPKLLHITKSDPSDPVIHGRELVRVGKQAVADGQLVVDRLRSELRERRLSSPMPWLEPIGSAAAQTLTAFARPLKLPIRDDLFARALELTRLQRRVAAGMTFLELRRSFSRDRDWIAYIFERLPPEIPIAQVETLVGNIAFRSGPLHCVGCGAQTRNECGCGKNYAPAETPWDNEPESVSKVSALERAMEAIAADPDKSNRLIAKEIGVSEFTIRKARKKIAKIAVEIAVERTGADGRIRKLPSSKVVAPKPAPPDPNRDLMQDEDPNAVTVEQRWSWSFSFHGGESIAAPAFWDRQFGTAWRELQVEPEHVAIAQQAAATWQAIAEDLARRVTNRRRKR